jgi:parallel beta-helix repeat protein
VNVRKGVAVTLVAAFILVVGLVIGRARSAYDYPKGVKRFTLSAAGSEIYVDGQIGPLSCGDYDVAARACGAGALMAYQTFAGATAAATAGDIVYIRQGVYNEPLIVQNSGTPGNPLTFRNYNSESAVISGASLSPAVDLSSMQYIVVDGLEVTDVRRWLYAVNAHHNLIQNNIFRRALDPGHSQKTGLFFQEATFNKILNNIIEDSAEDSLYLVKSDYNLVVGNEFRKAYHTLWAIKCGNYNVLRDNYFHNEDQKIGEIYDCHDVGFDHEFFLYDATKHNLVDGNDFAYVPSSGDHSPYSGIQYAGQEGIIRKNRFYNTVGPGLSMTLYPEEARYNTDNRVYHNVFYKTDFAGVEISGSDSYTFSGNEFKNNIFFNSLFVANDTRWAWYTDELDGQPVQIMTGRLDGFAFDSNNLFNEAPGELYLIAYGSRFSISNPAPQPVDWWEANHPELFTNILEADPAFRDQGGFDFHLAPPSLMIDAGAFLSQAVGDGSGPVLPVQDASYFYDGYGIPDEVGDEIQLEGSLDTAIVIAIDLSSNTLTLDRPLSWSAGQGVALAYEGSAPDLGAYEFEPSLTLYGIPGDREIHLDWTVDIAVPVTATWQIDYMGPVGDEPPPIMGLPSVTHAYTLSGLMNYATYTVTLQAMLDDSPFLTDTVQVMPTDLFVWLPVVSKE